MKHFWFVFLVFRRKKLHSVHIFIGFIMRFVGFLLVVFLVCFLGFS